MAPSDLSHVVLSAAHAHFKTEMDNRWVLYPEIAAIQTDDKRLPVPPGYTLHWAGPPPEERLPNLHIVNFLL